MWGEPRGEARDERVEWGVGGWNSRAGAAAWHWAESDAVRRLMGVQHDGIRPSAACCRLQLLRFQ